MARRHRRRSERPAQPVGDAAGSHERVETWPDGEWVVRRITGSTSTRTYRCPGCDLEIRPATPHVVAWPTYPTGFTGEGIDERRHWHTGCWSRRRPGR